MNNIDRLYQVDLGKEKKTIKFVNRAHSTFRLTGTNEHNVRIEISPHHGYKNIVIHYHFMGKGEGYDSFVLDYEELKKMFPDSNIADFKKEIIKWEMECVTREV
jgi:hypothetical protein